MDILRDSISRHRYCVFFIKDEKFITVEKMGGRDASYDDFLADLQSGGEGECRYGLYDFEYEHQCQVRTIIFFFPFNSCKNAKSLVFYLLCMSVFSEKV